MKKFIRIISVLILALFIAGFFLSRGDIIDIEEKDAFNTFITDQRLSNSGNFKNVSLSIIKTATSDSKLGLIVGGESIFESFIISHNAIFIHHPKGNVLFDTGLGKKIDQQFQDIPEALRGFLKYNFNQAAKDIIEPTKQQLKSIIISHFHWDHVGGIKDFPEAEILVSEKDLTRAMQGEDGALLSQIEGTGIKWKHIAYSNIPYENFESSLDIYEDGSLVLVPLPGHTIGSLGLFVNTESGARYLLTGDVTYSLLGFTKPAEKSFLLKNVLDYDNEMLIDTILRVHYLMEKHPDLIVVPAHDFVLQSSLPQFKP